MIPATESICSNKPFRTSKFWVLERMTVISSPRFRSRASV